MTEQTEWRSGDVVVIEQPESDDLWWVVADHLAVDGVSDAGSVPKALFPDPQFLAEQVNAQQPKPRWRTVGCDIYDHENSDLYAPAVRAYGAVHYGSDPDLAERIASLLNADEADR
jgi:hypothetical protein